MKKLIEEFRAFAMRGNVLDLAVGVVLGGAFNSIISSFVKDIIMPLLSIILGRINVAGLSLTIPGLFGSADIVLTYGLFVQAVINFFVIALAVFICIKFINRMKDRFKGSESGAGSEEKAALSKSEELLTEIRDLLSQRAKD